MDGITATTPASSAAPATTAATAAAATTATTASTSRTTKKLCFYIAVVLGTQLHEGYAKLLVHFSPFLLDPAVGVVKGLVVI